MLGSANSAVPGTPAGFAELFTVSGTGAENVSQIDLAVTTVSGLETFAASIWTDVGELPGAQVSGAYWSLSTNAPAGTCCSMVSVAVSGVTLTGGQQYFMVLRPASFSDDSYHSWNTNNQGLTGTVEYTGDGITYLDNGIPGAMSAFDVLGTPEPASTSLSAVGLTCLIALRRRKTS